MSHGVHIPLRGIRNIEYLAEALRRMGEQVEIGDDLIVHADDGDRRVELRCAQQGEYAIGFHQSGGQYHAFADWYWIDRDREEFLRVLRQQYQAVATLAELAREGLVHICSERFDAATGQIIIEVEEGDLEASLRGVEGIRRGAQASVSSEGELHLEMRGYIGSSCEEATRSLERSLGPVAARHYLPERWSEEEVSGIGIGEV